MGKLEEVGECLPGRMAGYKGMGMGGKTLLGAVLTWPRHKLWKRQTGNIHRSTASDT